MHHCRGVGAAKPIDGGEVSREQSPSMKNAMSARCAKIFSSNGSRLCSGISVEVLNAKPEAARREAEIIAQAGLPQTSRPSRWGSAAVTIATSMAGRGTDIRLGGDPLGITKIALRDLYLPGMLTHPALDHL